MSGDGTKDSASGAMPDDEDISDSATGANEAWVGSDATSHEFYESGFRNKSEIGIAIAVENRNKFNTKYRGIIEEKANEYGFSPKRPVLKSHGIRNNASEWEYGEIISDFVEELLEIDSITNIHATITTITNQMVVAFKEGGGPLEQISRDELHGELANYYHLITIWDYLDEYRDAPWGTANVLLDDFEGKDNKPWRRTGVISDDLYVIPQGDATYPLLSLADLTMEYVKENVDDWTEDDIRSTLIDATPEDTAYVNVKGLHTPQEVDEMVPIARRNINRAKHYPHPIVFIDRAGLDREKFTNYKLYHTIAEYVYKNSGCMKYFSDTEDGEIVDPDDFIVCLDEDDAEKYRDFESLNDSSDIVLTPDEAFEQFS